MLVVQVISLMDLLILVIIQARLVHVLLLLDLLQAVLLMLGDGGDSLNVLLYAYHH